MKPFRSTLIFLLAAVLLLFVLWLTKNVQGTADAEKAKGRLFSFSGDDVASLKIKTGDGTVSLEKKGADWRIVEPVQAEAEREAVLALLGELEFLQPRRTIAASEIPDGEKSLAEWGLSPASGRIEVSGKGGDGKPFTEVLLVGRKAAVPGLSYAKKEGEKSGDAYLIAASSRDAFFKKLDDLRTHSVIHADAASIDQCGLRQKASPSPDAPSEFQISRGKDVGSEWHVDKPLSAPASAARVSAWLRQLDALRVKQFVSDDAADLTAYGLTAPTAQIWIRRQAPAPEPAKDSKDKDAKDKAKKPNAIEQLAAPAPEPETLLIGIPVPGVPGEVYAKKASESGVFTLPDEAVAKLLADLPAARDRKVLAFATGDAVGFRVELPKPSAPGSLSIVEVKKADGKWVFGDATTGGAAGKEADAAQVEAFLGELSILEAPKIVRDTASDLKPFGLDKPSIRLAVLVKKGDATEERVLSLGKIEKVGAQQLLYAANSTQPFVYGLDIGFLTRFPREAWKWRSPLAFGSGLKEDAITAVTRALPGKPPETIKRNAAVFVSDAGAIDQTKAKALWARLPGLASVHWIGAPVAAYGLGTQAARITISEGDAKRVLILGAAVQAVPTSGRAAQIEGENDVFLISESDYAFLTGSLAPAAATAP